jgi:chromosome condensin MukBEF MukE localization factor
VKRIFWLLFGIVLGVYAVTRLKSRAKALSPAGVDKLADAVRDFGEEVRAGMDQREAELREALGLDIDGRAQGTTEKAEYGDR